MSLSCISDRINSIKTSDNRLKEHFASYKSKSDLDLNQFQRILPNFQQYLNFSVGNKIKHYTISDGLDLPQCHCYPDCTDLTYEVETNDYTILKDPSFLNLPHQ